MPPNCEINEEARIEKRRGYVSYSKFWLVWREAGSTPTRKHTTRGSAYNEAERLSKENPGVRYHVVQNEAAYEATVTATGWSEPLQ